MPPIPKRKSERAPAIDRLLMPAIGLAVALLAYFVMQGIHSEIPRIDVQDELILRDVFFGEGEGKNYVALCHTDFSTATSTTNNKNGKISNVPISSAFTDARNDGSSSSLKADFVLVDCAYVLPSNKTIAERFALDVTKRPTIFVSGKTGPPKQIPLKHLKTGNMLLKVLRQMLEPHAAKIEVTRALKTKCLAHDWCAILLKGGPVEKYVKETIQNLIVEYPNVHFASMDSSNLLLSNLENIDLPEFNRGTHRFIMFKKVSGSLEMKNDTTTTVDSGRLITSIASYQGRDYRHIPLGNFVQSVVSGKTKCEKLPALPAIKSRTKKNEEQERKKRQRAQERKVREAQQRAADAGGTGGGGAFTSTTLDEKSREARRAERERLREEHMRTLTPEEIAEKERARRQRMEEEAAQWNIMSEDEGDTYDEVVEEDTELDDDSDDDVLDLD